MAFNPSLITEISPERKGKQFFPYDNRAVFSVTVNDAERILTIAGDHELSGEEIHDLLAFFGFQEEMDVSVETGIMLDLTFRQKLIVIQ